MITAPGECAAEPGECAADVAPPAAGSGEVVVDVERAGICGAAAEFCTGEMAYLYWPQDRRPVRVTAQGPRPPHQRRKDPRR